MKKLLLLSSIVLGATVLSGCSFKDKFYITNWGEYINEDLLDEFGKEFNVKVVQTELISNELMYADLKQDNYPCDVVFPSDYMVEKLKNEKLIEELDFSKLDNYSEGMYSTGLDTLISESGYSDYFIPYFWGTLGIMYNTDVAGLESDIATYDWEMFFNNTMLNKYKVGMYDSSRDSFAAGSMYLRDLNNDSSYSFNNYSNEQLNEVSSLLSNAKYNTWGDDNLKGRVATGNLDYALVYSGDFFDQLYADDYEDIDYDIYIPETNNVFFDAMCIPTNSQNKELAYEFINFMIDKDNAIENALEVGYAPTIQSVLTTVLADEDMADVIAYKAWNPQNLLDRSSNAFVYKDLGQTYLTMEELFTKLRVGK